MCKCPSFLRCLPLWVESCSGSSYLRFDRSDALTGDKADCGVIWRQLNNAWKQRDNAISACIGYAEQEVALIQAEKASGVADQDEIELEERRAKKSLSLMKSEVDIESIMRERSKEFFKRKCRAFMVANGIKF